MLQGLFLNLIRLNDRIYELIFVFQVKYQTQSAAVNKLSIIESVN